MLGRPGTVVFALALLAAGIGAADSRPNWPISVLGGPERALAQSGTNGPSPLATLFSITGGSAGDIVAGPDGALWFTSFGGGPNIRRMSTAGIVQPYPISFGDARGIIAGPDGALWFKTHIPGRLGSITTQGIATPITVPSAHQISIGDIIAGPDGAIWFPYYREPFSLSDPTRIGRLRLNGEFHEFTSPTATGPAGGITVGPDGALWFTAQSAGKIGRITTAGEIREFPLPPNNLPSAITTGPDGALWFTQPGQFKKIGRITTTGETKEYPIPREISSTKITTGPDGALWFALHPGFPTRLGSITMTGEFSEILAANEGFNGGPITGPDGALWFTMSASRVGRFQPGQTLSASPVHVWANGHEETRLTARGTPGHTVSITADGAVVIDPPHATFGTDGTAIFKAKSATVGTVTFNAVDSASPGTPKSATVQFQTRKVAIQFLGIRTSLKCYDDGTCSVRDLDGDISPADDRFRLLRDKLEVMGFKRDHLIWYSYSGAHINTLTGQWTGNDYDCAHTKQNLRTSILELGRLLQGFGEHNPNTEFYLIGHSQGGLIAFQSLGLLGTLPPKTRVAAIFTMDSPLGGVPLSLPSAIVNATCYGNPASSQLNALHNSSGGFTNSQGSSATLLCGLLEVAPCMNVNNRLAVLNAAQGASRTLTYTYGFRDDPIYKPNTCILDSIPGATVDNSSTQIVDSATEAPLDILGDGFPGGLNISGCISTRHAAGADRRADVIATRIGTQTGYTPVTNVVAAGDNATISLPPSATNQAGVVATVRNNTAGSGPLTVTAETASANPTDGKVFDVGGGFVDFRIVGAHTADSATAQFYYPSVIVGANEAALQLYHFTGTHWDLVRSSGNMAPTKNTADNLDGTISGGRFGVTFDSTSVPPITALTGTWFTASIPDTTPPAITPTVVGSLGSAGWHTSDVGVNWGVVDPQTSIISTDGCGTRSVAADTSGTTLTCKAISGGGTATQSMTIKRDATPASTSAIANPVPNIGGWQDRNVIVNLAATDNTSGVAKTEYNLDNAGWRVYGDPIAITSEGVHTLLYRSMDIAGNQEPVKTLTVRLDKTTPTTTATPDSQPNAAGWYRMNIAVTLAAADNTGGSGVAKTEYKLDDGAWTVYNTAIPVSADGPHTLLYRSTDVAGNQETAKTLTVRLDKSPPTLRCTASPNTLWPPNRRLVTVTTTVTADDALSGPAGLRLQSVVSSEPGDGQTSGWPIGTQVPATTQGAGSFQAQQQGQLEADRAGNGSGRVYTLTYQGVDIASNTATCVTTVTVPHDQGR